MSEAWEEKTIRVEYDGHDAGTIVCEMKRQRAFGFAPQLKALVRVAVDLTGKPAEVPRPTRTSTFTLWSGGAVLGRKDGWRVKDLETDDEPDHQRFWLVLETL